MEKASHIRGGRGVELLAPAGNIEGFYGAVSAGADAVYLGGSRFGARAYADNFTQEELVECIRYAHLFGVKIYLTVNTLLKDRELQELGSYLAPFYEAGLDAVIVQDIGVLQVVRRLFPGLHIHASTQMTLCDGYGARLLQEMGASRIVPARELSLEELSAIRQSADIELETFIHGAMCYCYSGQCLFSSILGGRSGNRGRCAQPCRLPYTVGETDTRTQKEMYPLSLKDLCTIEHIPALMEAGIDSFKIEGRMKKPEYAAGVTAIYRKYIDLYESLKDRLGAQAAAREYKVSARDRHILSSLYIRSELQDGYYFKHNGKEMVTLQSPAYSGSEEELLQEIRERYLTARPRIPVTIEALFCTGEPAVVTMQSGDISVRIQGGQVAPAQRQPISGENVEKQLGKLGDSAFYADQKKIQVSKDAFYPLKQINELRRDAVEALEQAIWKKNGYLPRMAFLAGADDVGRNDRKREEKAKASHKPLWVIAVRTLEQLRTLVDWIQTGNGCLPARVYVDGDLLAGSFPDTAALCRKLPEETLCMVSLPYIIRKRDQGCLEKLLCMIEENPFLFSGFLARSLDGFQFLQEQVMPKYPDLQIRTDANLYCWNQETVSWLTKYADGFCLPYELNRQERHALIRGKNGKAELSGNMVPKEELPGEWEKIVYGRIPMMVTANCLQKTTGQCRKKSGELQLHDRYQKEFPVIYNCMHCMNIIYNSVPLVLKPSSLEEGGRGALRLDFTIEKTDEMVQILDIFLKGQGSFLGEYTTGHEKRGVE